MKHAFESYLNTVCEIKTMNNELLLIGRVYRVLDEENLALDIAAAVAGDMLPLIQYNTPVKLVLRKGGQLLILGGYTYIANEIFWRISNITQYQNVERRGFFRVTSAAKGLISPIVGSEEGELPSYVAQLINISLSGVKFSSEELFENGYLLQLHSISLRNDQMPFSASCKVVAREELLGYAFPYQYRCHFQEMSDKDSDRLCQAIFSIQRDDIKKSQSKLL